MFLCVTKMMVIMLGWLAASNASECSRGRNDPLVDRTPDGIMGGSGTSEHLLDPLASDIRFPLGRLLESQGSFSGTGSAMIGLRALGNRRTLADFAIELQAIFGGSALPEVADRLGLLAVAAAFFGYIDSSHDVNLRNRFAAWSGLGGITTPARPAFIIA